MNFLVVENDPVLCRLLARWLPGEVSQATTLAAARQRLADTGADVALVVDVVLPDGSGLDLLRDVRRHTAWRPALIVTAHRSEGLLVAAQRLGAFLVHKPVPLDAIAAFGGFARGVFQQCVDELFRARVEAASHRYGLSRREHEVLMLACMGVPRHEMADRLGIAETTLKTFVRRIVRKAGRYTLGDLVTSVHQRLFVPDEVEDGDAETRCSEHRVASAESTEVADASAIPAADLPRTAVSDNVLHELNGIIMSLSLIHDELTSGGVVASRSAAVRDLGSAVRQLLELAKDLRNQR